jgi:hypothetical protein
VRRAISILAAPSGRISERGFVLSGPLTITYLDLESYLERRQEQLTLEAVEDATRRQFLEEF